MLAIETSEENEFIKTELNGISASDVSKVEWCLGAEWRDSELVWLQTGKCHLDLKIYGNS